MTVDLSSLAIPLPSDEEYLAFLDGAEKAKILGIDTETTTFNKRKHGSRKAKWEANIQGGTDYAMGLSISYKENGLYKSTYIPFRHPSDNAGPAVLTRVKQVIEGKKWAVFHNAKFDLPSLATLGINYEGQFYDTMIMAHLINENKPRSKRLDTLCRYYLGPDYHKEMHPALATWIELFGWHTVPGKVMYAYATQDAHITLMLAEILLPKMMKEIGENKLYWRHKQDLIRVLVKMKKWGVRVDAERCKRMVSRADDELAEAQRQIGFKPTPAAIGQYFTRTLGLPVLAWTDGGKSGNPKPSFTAAILDEYEEYISKLQISDDKKNIVQNILKYRGWQKARSSFYQAWLDHMDADGRVRPDYVMHKDPDDGGTVTGRFSCREPNLQQIPRITSKEWNKDVKPCLIPAEGYVLVEADYSQLELRLATAYAREHSLIQVFNEGRDIFSEMSIRMGLERDDTKRFVYATQYGAGDTKVASFLGITRSQAQLIRQNYISTYPGFRALAEDAKGKALQNGRVRLWSGRHRHFEDPEEEARKAMNSCIQGGAADIVEQIMVKCDKTFVDWDECRMLLQIHDALIFEIRKDRLEYYLPLIKSTMESVNELAPFGVTFAVDIHKWGTKEKLL